MVILTLMCGKGVFSSNFAQVNLILSYLDIRSWKSTHPFLDVNTVDRGRKLHLQLAFGPLWSRRLIQRLGRIAGMAWVLAGWQDCSQNCRIMQHFMLKVSPLLLSLFHSLTTSRPPRPASYPRASQTSASAPYSPGAEPPPPPSHITLTYIMSSRVLLPRRFGSVW